MNLMWRTVFFDQCIYYLARLIQRAQHDRIAWNVQFFVEFESSILVSSRIEGWQIFMLARADLMQLTMVIPGLQTGLVVTHSRLHVWQNVVERFQRQIAEFIETGRQQFCNHSVLVRQIQLGQFTLDLLVFLVNRKHAGNFIQKLRPAIQCGD